MKPSRFRHFLVLIVAGSSLPVPPRTWCLWVGGNFKAWGKGWEEESLSLTPISRGGCISPHYQCWGQPGGVGETSHSIWGLPGLLSVATLGLGLDGLILLSGRCKTPCSCVVPLVLGFPASSPPSYHLSSGRFSFGSLLHFF